MKKVHRSSDVDRVVSEVRALSLELVVSPGQFPSAFPGRVLKVPALEVTLSRASRLLRVALANPSRPDGFPSSTPGNGSPGGGKGGQRMMSVPGADGGPAELVPTTSVEVAAIDQARALPDAVALQAREAWAHLVKILDGLAGLERVCDRFDRLQSSSDVVDPPMCWLAQVRYRLPYDVMWDVQHDGRTTDFAGQLDQPFDEPRRVSMFVYWFVRNHKRLPERAEMLGYLERQTVKVRG